MSVNFDSDKAYADATKLWEDAAANKEIQDGMKKLILDDIKMLEKHEDEIKERIADFRKKNPEIYSLDVEAYDKIYKKI